MREPCPRLLLVLCALLIAAGSPCQAAADDQTLAGGRAELRNAMASSVHRPSFDTTPVEFAVGGIRYRIPRNYLVTMADWNGGEQGLVGLRVNLPGLEPITPETRECFQRGSLAGTPGCDPLLFWINSPGGVSADEAFANSRDVYRNQEPIHAPFGYEKYEIGPENARSERYRKVEDGRTLLYTCQIFESYGNRRGFCSPTGDRVSTGAVIQFYIDLRHLKDIDEIDASLRNLVEQFTIRSGEEK
jgi:hypothetical protein